MGIAEALAAISAAMQAIDLYSKFASRDEVVQTLNLANDPARYRGLAVQLQASAEAEGRSRETYEKLFDNAGKRALGCAEQLLNDMNSNLMPSERERLGNAARACTCREIAVIKDFMAGQLPAELLRLWDRHRCDEFYANVAAGSAEPARWR